MNNGKFPNTEALYKKWETSKNDNDSIFLIIEPVYWFFTPLNYNVNPPSSKVALQKFWYGTPYTLGQQMGAALASGGKEVATKERTSGSKVGEDGILEYGYYYNNLYTNGNYGTFVRTAGPQTNLGIYNAGSSFSNNPPRIKFSELADKKNGLGIGLFWIGHDMDGDDPGDPEEPEILTKTYKYPGTANPDVWTWNDALPEYDLSNLLDPIGRIPSGKNLTNGILVDEWFCSYSTKKTEESKQVFVQYKVQDGAWSSWYTGSDVIDSSDSDYSHGQARGVLSTKFSL